MEIYMALDNPNYDHNVMQYRTHFIARVLVLKQAMESSYKFS